MVRHNPTPQLVVLHTLGPHGTNCEKAAHAWFAARGLPAGDVLLYPTLEEAMARTPREFGHGVMACAVYPDLHRLVFDHHPIFVLADSFLCDTDEMVVAVRDPSLVQRLASHPAPRSLLAWADEDVLESPSNAQAALDCARGVVDACITTALAAANHGLHVTRSFGAVPMVFTIHVPREVSS